MPPVITAWSMRCWLRARRRRFPPVNPRAELTMQDSRARRVRHAAGPDVSRPGALIVCKGPDNVDNGTRPSQGQRSEERRVGKERRSRWTPKAEKKNRKQKQNSSHEGR